MTYVLNMWNTYVLTFSSQDEKMKSLEQKLAEVEAKIENLSYTKLAIENKSVFVFVPVKPKDNLYPSLQEES